MLAPFTLDEMPVRRVLHAKLGAEYRAFTEDSVMNRMTTITRRASRQFVGLSSQILYMLLIRQKLGNMFPEILQSQPGPRV